MTEKELQPKLNFAPAVIEINNMDDMKKFVSEVVTKYGDVLVTDETKADATDARKQLKDTADGLKDVVKKINEKVAENATPIVTELNKLERETRQAYRKVQDQIAELEKKKAQEKAEQRRQKISVIIETSNTVFEIDTQRITWGPKWLTTETFTNIQNEIEEQMRTIKQADDALKAQEEAIVMVAESYGLEQEAYLSLIGVKPFDEIKQIMNQAVKNKRAREAQEAAEQQQILEAKQNKQNETKEMQPVVNEEANEPEQKQVNVNTPHEVKNSTEGKSEPIISEQKKIKNLAVLVDKREYDLLAKFMVDNNIKHKFTNYEEKQK